MIKVPLFVRVSLGILLLASVACADNLLDVTGALTVGDPTQQGRISRNGVPSDWSSQKLFPGVINTGVTYHYTEYTVSSGVTPFIEVTLDSTPNVFVAAFLGGYDPTNIAATYIGDPGNSEPFGFPASFQVVVPKNTDLTLVINNTGNADAGVGDPYELIVQGFLDTQFTNTPEPSSLLLLGSGALGVAGLVRRKLRLG
jgi:PEP-CTERM motif